MSAFGEFLYALRKENGMTQAELAERLGVTNKAVSKWETGEAMPESNLLLPIARISALLWTNCWTANAGKTKRRNSRPNALPLTK